MEDIYKSPYFGKIVLILIALIIKLIFGFILKTEKNHKGVLIFIYYLIPIFIIIWLNLDKEIKNTKFTTTLICINVGFLLFNYFQTKISEQYKIIRKYGKIEKEKIKEINNINNTQAEKMKGIVNNQKYILNELSNINDRIINFIFKSTK